MNLQSKQLNEITYEDVETFVGYKLKENEHIEYKSFWPHQSLSLWLCAFANTFGGLILLGVEADEDEQAKGICGIPDDQARTDLVDGEQFKVSPPLIGLVDSIRIPHRDITGKSVLLIRVKAGAGDVPFSVNGIVYIRTNGSKRAVTDKNSDRVAGANVEEILRLARKRESAVLLRDQMIKNARGRAQAFNSQFRTEVIVIPCHPGPVSAHKHQEFEKLVAASYVEIQGSKIVSGYFPRISAQPLRSSDGIAHTRNGLFIECQRFGLIYAVSTQCETDTETWTYTDDRTGDSYSVLGLNQVAELIFATLVFAARMIDVTQRNSDYLVEVNVYGTMNKTPVIYGDMANQFILPIKVPTLGCTAAAYSTELVRNPDALMPPLIDELFYPTSRPLDGLRFNHNRLVITDGDRKELWAAGKPFQVR